MAEEPRIRELREPTLGPPETWQTLSAGRTIKPRRAVEDESATLLTDSTSAAKDAGAGAEIPSEGTGRDALASVGR